MKGTLIWPDPVPCRPENPVQGIRRCIAREQNILCPWLKVSYCGVDTDDMSDALDELGLGALSWIFEDELDPDDVAEAAAEVRKALRKHRSNSSEAAIAIRWFANFLDVVEEHGCGLTDRFAERIDLRDRY